MSTGPIPAGYGQVLQSLKAEVRAAQFRAQRVVNTELLGLYWTIGKAILDQQAVEGYTYDTLPAAERSAMPTADDITAVLDTPWVRRKPSVRLSDALPSHQDQS